MISDTLFRTFFMSYILTVFYSQSSIICHCAFTLNVLRIYYILWCFGEICAMHFTWLQMCLDHWSQTQFLEGHSSAQFSSNPNQTHLLQLIKVFRIKNFQAGVIWSWLELNSAELWLSRNWVWDHWLRFCKYTCCSESLHSCFPFYIEDFINHICIIRSTYAYKKKYW